MRGIIPSEQKEAADEARKIINSTVGSYAEIKHSTNPSSERLRYSTNLAASGVTLQWIPGDASSAERSFHTINTAQTPIGDLEVHLIRDRRNPNAIATRALVHAATGRYYLQSIVGQSQRACGGDDHPSNNFQRLVKYVQQSRSSVLEGNVL